MHHQQEVFVDEGKGRLCWIINFQTRANTGVKQLMLEMVTHSHNPIPGSWWLHLQQTVRIGFIYIDNRVKTKLYILIHMNINIYIYMKKHMYSIPNKLCSCEDHLSNCCFPHKCFL